MRLVALAGALLLATAGAESPSPRRFALLVGCTEYPFLERQVAPEVYESKVRLRGPANDVALLRRLLVERLGVAEERITTLVGWSDAAPLKNPDRANVLRALVRLSREVVAGDEVLVFFAGHGSRQPDADGDEPDGMDEVILPADARRLGPGEARIPGAIPDDEIHARAAAIRDAGARVVLLFDCCHAGTLARGGEPGWRSRSLAPDLLGVPPPERRPISATGRPAQDLRGIVAVYACGAGEKAPERPLPKGEPSAPWHGLLTWTLASALGGPHPPPTWSDLLLRLRSAYLAFPWEGATPHLEGDGLREIGAAAGAGPTTPWGGIPAPLRIAWAAPEAQPAGRGGPLREATARAGIQVVERPEDADWVVVPTDTGVILRPAGLSSGPDAAFETDAEHLGSALAQVARVQGLMRLALGGTVPDLAGRVRAEILRRDGADEVPLGSGETLRPGDRIRIHVRNVSPTPQDVWVFVLDGAFGVSCLWPDPTTSPRIAAGAEPVSLETTVTDETLGTEHLLVAAFPSDLAQPPVNLRWIEAPPLEAASRTTRPPGAAGGGRLGDLLSDAAFPGGTTRPARAPGAPGTEGALGLLTWRTSWEPIPRREEPWTAEAPGILLEMGRGRRVATYDTDRDGAVDLVLEDVDEDPEADVRRTRRGEAWGVEEGLNVPWLQVSRVLFEDPEEYARAVDLLRTRLR